VGENEKMVSSVLPLVSSVEAGLHGIEMGNIALQLVRLLLLDAVAILEAEMPFLSEIALGVVVVVLLQARRRHPEYLSSTFVKALVCTHVLMWLYSATRDVEILYLGGSVHAVALCVFLLTLLVLPLWQLCSCGALSMVVPFASFLFFLFDTSFHRRMCLLLFLGSFFEHFTPLVARINTRRRSLEERGCQRGGRLHAPVRLPCDGHCVRVHH